MGWHAVDFEGAGQGCAGSSNSPQDNGPGNESRPLPSLDPKSMQIEVPLANRGRALPVPGFTGREQP